MEIRTKFSESGEFQPEWKPPVRCFVYLFKKNELSSEDQAIEAPPEAPPPEPEVIPAAKPAWRAITKRPERKPARTQPKAINAAPAPEPAVPEAPKPEGPAWAQWRRMCLQVNYVKMEIHCKLLQQILSCDPALLSILHQLPQLQCRTILPRVLVSSVFLKSPSFLPELSQYQH